MAENSSAVPFEAMIRAPLTNWLPKVWSPSAWVLTSTSIFSVAGIERRISASISPVSFRSNRVSTISDWSPSQITPAFDQPQDPSGTR